jgi:SAM-dependent methyltransferase
MTSRFITHQQARRFYDRIGRAQDARPISERRALDALAAHGDFAGAASVLEFGSGTGRFAARLLRDELPEGATYLGLDVSPHMVELARAAVAPWAGSARIELTDGAVHLPVADASCDRVVSTYVLDLLSPDDAAAFGRETRRVLRPGGLLALASLAPGRTAPARLVTALWQAVWRLNPALLGGCRPLTLRTLFDPEEWNLRAGFTVTDWFLSSDVLVAQRR